MRSRASTQRGLTLGFVVALAAAACSPPQPPTLTRVQAEVFDKSCNFSSCHSGSGSNGLNLEKPTWAKLVNVKSVGPADLRALVVPGKPDDSYLVQKLTQTSPAAGARMPNTGTPLEAERLQLVRGWVEAGAQDD